MGKQLDMFSAPEPDANDRLNAAQADMRLGQMRRADTRPRFRASHRESRAVQCPSCGACVTIPVQ